MQREHWFYFYKKCDTVICYRVKCAIFWIPYRTTTTLKRQTSVKSLKGFLFHSLLWCLMAQPVAYAENFHGGRLVQRQMVVICIGCALSVTSQFDVISMFPNQRFGEVCWHNMICIIFTSTPLISCVVALSINYQRSKLGYRRKTNSMQRHSSS